MKWTWVLAVVCVSSAACARTPEQRCRRAPPNPSITETTIVQSMTTAARQQIGNGGDVRALIEPMGMSYCSLAKNLETSNPASADMYRSMGVAILEMADKQEPDSDPFSVIQNWVKPD